MNFIFLQILSAFWLGLLTSISPCPLATNITAISFITNKSSNLKQVSAISLCYTMGRSLVYIILASLIISGILLTPRLSHFLQKYIDLFLGPLLILIGVFLLDFIKFAMPFSLDTNKYAKNLIQSKYLGSFLLGALFALSFCPISAVLYFGSLIPLAIKTKSIFWLPLSYGLGTAIPVFLLAIISTGGMKKVSAIFPKISKLETYGRIMTGIIFLLAGIYYTFTYIYEWAISLSS